LKTTRIRLFSYKHFTGEANLDLIFIDKLGLMRTILTVIDIKIRKHLFRSPNSTLILSVESPEKCFPVWKKKKVIFTEKLVVI